MADRPVFYKQNAGRKTLVRIILLAACGLLAWLPVPAATDVRAGHITTGQGWRTGLEIFAGAVSPPGSCRLTRLDDQGRVLGDPLDLPLQSLAWNSVPAGALEYNGSARIESDQDLLVKVSYQYGDTPSLCQFFLTGETRQEWILPNPPRPWLDWTGLALVNPDAGRASITLEAWQNGGRIRERSISLTSGSRFVQLSDTIWDGLSAHGFDSVIVRSTLPLPAPLAIHGNRAQDRHLFFPAQPLPSGRGYRCLVNATLINGTGRPPVPDAAVLFRDSVILAAGPRDQVAIPAGAELLDAGGAYILPGFINAHVHNTLRTANLRTWARAGVTTVRDVGAAEDAEDVFRFREEIRSDPACARLVAAGPLVTVPGGYPLVPNNFPALPVTGPADAREKISRLIGQGAELIKITLERSRNLPMLSAEEVRAIAETAHQWKLPVTVHLTGSAYIPRALDAGVDQIEHICYDYLSDELIGRMVQNGVILIPTLTALGNHPQAVSNCRRFLAAGGKVALGNDSGYIAGLEIGMPADELLALQGAGMTPMQVIQAATRTSAEACRLQSILGTIEPGKQADLLLVAANPLENLQNLRQVRAVFHAGVAIRPLTPATAPQE